MPVVDARVRVHHPCPYCDLSVEFPGVLFLLWCDNRRDTFLVSAPDPKALRRVLRALRESFHARPVVVDGPEAIVAVPDFEWSSPPSVTGMARRAGVWVLHPVVYYEGKETYRLVSGGKPPLHRLITRLRRLGDVELLSVSDRASLTRVRDLPESGVHFFEGLTDQQARSLVAAYEGGLFEVPSRGSWADVARRVGLSRSTFGEHLRKAQHRLVVNSYASLRARSTERTEPELLPQLPAATPIRRSPLHGTRKPPTAAERRSP
jgi:predicted DNA binding protein